VESGLIILIGATTENPSFEVIPALMSRCRVITLSALTHEQMRELLNRALADRGKGMGMLNLRISDAAMDQIVSLSDGDARAALTALEISAVNAAGRSDRTDDGFAEITPADVEQAMGKKALIHDKDGESHYNLISAFHKSLRGSDPDAALYWLARMMSAGEDPAYIARRMVRFAAEDIGNADPRALALTMDAMQAYRFLGSPEGDLCLAQAAVYLACAPKSNRTYSAYNAVLETIRKTGSLPVPFHIRNAPTKLMKELGYGKDYQYAHDHPGAFTAQQYLPDELKGTIFYTPTDRGYEKMMGERLAYWRAAMRRMQKDDAGK
jgi:putative ATPase